MGPGYMIYILAEVIIAACCCLGNILALVALWNIKTIQKPTFSLIASLAVADFLVGTVAIPSSVLLNGQLKTSFHACLFISCMIIFPTVVSVLCLVAIAVDRFLRVLVPLRYKRSVTWKHACLMVATCWLVALPLSFTPMFGWHKDLRELENSTNVCKFVGVISMSYLVYFNFFLCNLTPLLMITVLYSFLFCYIRESLKAKPGNGTENQTQDYLRKEKKLAASLSLVLVLFALSWFPLHIMNCIFYFKGPTAISPTAFYFGIVLTHANSAINPVVYAFKIKKIRSAHLKIWRKYLWCSVENHDSLAIDRQNISINPDTYERTIE